MNKHEQAEPRHVAKSVQCRGQILCESRVCTSFDGIFIHENASFSDRTKGLCTETIHRINPINHVVVIAPFRKSRNCIIEQLAGEVYLMAVNVIVEVIIDLINDVSNNGPIQARTDELPLLDYCQGAQVCLR